jgi:hypothetical protein
MNRPPVDPVVVLFVVIIVALSVFAVLYVRV